MSFASRCLLLTLMLPGLAQANELLRAYQRALDNDPTIRAARYERDAAVQVEPKARALLLPQLSAGYNEVFNDSKVDVTYTDPVSGQNVGLNRRNNGTDTNLSVTLTQPLFNLESWYQLKQANEQAALAQLNYRSDEQALLLRVADAYFGLLGAHDRLRTAQAEKSALQRRLDLANQNLEVGLSSITDVQDVQARRDLSLADELAAAQALTAAQLALEQITKEPATAAVGAPVQVVAAPEGGAEQPVATLREDMPLLLPQPARVGEWLDFAGQDNLDLIASQLSFNIAARGVDAAKARYLPTLAATANYNNSRSGGGTFPTTVVGPSVGLGVTLPLFSGGATQADLRRSVATREQRRAEYDGVRRQIESDTRNAYQGVVTGVARVQALRQALASSVSELDASETGLSIGTRSAVDVLNAQQQRYGAERDYEQSRYDYLLSVLKLKAAAGRLNAKDLAEVDALLGPPERPEQVAAVVVPESVPVAAVDNRPPPPPPVPAPSAAPTARGGRVWYAQIGSFANRDNAQNLLARLQAAGIQAEVASSRPVSGVVLYRVRLAAFPSESDARQACDKLVQQGYSQAQVIVASGATAR